MYKLFIREIIPLFPTLFSSGSAVDKRASECYSYSRQYMTPEFCVLVRKTREAYC